MKKMLTITIDKKILEDFRKLCKEEGFKMSTKIEKLIETFMKN